MSRCRPIRRLLALASLAWGLAGSSAGRASECLQGPLPDNPDNAVGLCSPSADSVQVRVRLDGLELSWDAPPRATTTFTSPVTAARWLGVDSTAVVPGVTVRGVYLAYRDRRIQLDVQSIDSLGVSITSGFIGRDRIRISWTSIYEASATGAVGGVIDVLPSYDGVTGFRFEIPNPNPTFPPDTTTLAGLRVAFRSGLPVRSLDAAIFDVEDFEGWHVWRWGADPTSPNYEAIGEYTKLRDVAAPVYSWPGITPAVRRLVFLDRNVFDGFLYHYAITAYDQGFRRATSGTDLAIKIDSPLEPAERLPDGTLQLGPTQVRVSYRKPPPANFFPVAAVPNPFRESTADPNRPETQVVQFINSPARGTLYIFTVAGDLVLQRDHEQATVGTIEWDTRNQSGLKVTSGVYIYKIVDLISGEQSYGRLAIIR